MKKDYAYKNVGGQPDDVGKVVGALAIGSFSCSTSKVFKVDGSLQFPDYRFNGHMFAVAL